MAGVAVFSGFHRELPYPQQANRSNSMTDSSMLARETHAGAVRAALDRSAAGSTQPALLSASAVSWGAVVAGAAGAAALSLILLVLGTGLGLSTVSPFSGQGASGTTFGVSTIAWVTFVQLAASGMGGYLAGRLRTRWVSTHADEVFFRDTAHGFLAWAIATLATAAMLTSAIASVVGTGADTAGAVAGAAGTTAIAAVAPVAAKADGNGYFVDSLFRKDASAAPSATSTTGAVGAPGDAAASTAEAGRIFAAGLEAGTLPPDDTKYLGQLVAQRAGLSQADAEKRVTDAFGRMKAKADQVKDQARAAADKARKASAHAALWLFVSLLVGAFVASFMATFGGRQRDLV
jgi:hypothetical protein